MPSPSSSPSQDRPSPAFWVPTLYFAEGLPFVLIATVSTLMYKSMGISDAQIAFFTTIVMWPWTFKPLWGPFLEMFKTKKYFVVATQFFGGVLCGLVALSLPLEGFFQLSLVVFAIMAFNGATHDIAADGVYINALTPEQQGKYVGWQGAFYNIAKVLAQGGFVYLAGQLETSVGVEQAWMIVMGVVGAILVMISLYHLKVLPSGGAARAVHTVREASDRFGEVVTTFFQKKRIVLAIVFIILYRFAEGQAIKIVPLFLRAARENGGLGLTTSEIGIVYGTFGAAAFILGSILAGYFTGKHGLRKSLFILCCFFNIPFVVYTYLSMTTPDSLAVIGICIVFEMFGYGFGFVGLILYMMQQIAPGRYQMAHYAFATGLMNLGMMIPSMLSGYVSDWLGYERFFIWVMVATIPSFFVTWIAPFNTPRPEKAAGVA